MPTLSSKLNRGETEVAHTDSWMVIKWMDKKEVYVLTSIHEHQFCKTGRKNYKTNEDIIKPVCIVDYNKNMGKIDDIDRQLSLTESIRKCMKWYRKLFFHLIDLILINSHSLFKMLTKNAILFPDFRLSVVRDILKVNSQEVSSFISSNFRLNGRHFPRKIQASDDSKTVSRQCVLCSIHKKRSRSSYECKVCCKTLCIELCFEIYHTKRSLS
ncbi:piggyBac transposable element-derived protein 4-like [Odontomachus brunneus]|uniref:piggyBac transposable element-derived protein 4-like n=1 Tax=Odontomachus brunneus TaxID=486640 RepID=UPI0013F26B74|nr:piggyBac transposable element-derived protein 4-like [Odontomachus brunneus]